MTQPGSDLEAVPAAPAPAPADVPAPAAQRPVQTVLHFHGVFYRRVMPWRRHSRLRRHRQIHRLGAD
jgi:hypothetical protein